MTTATTKLTPAQTKVVEALRNAMPIDDLIALANSHQPYSPPAATLLRDGSIQIRGSSTTLRALVAKGVIELVEVGGLMSDVVRLI